MKTALLAATFVAFIAVPALAQSPSGTSPASTTSKAQGTQGATEMTPGSSASEMMPAPRKAKTKHAKTMAKHRASKSPM